MKSVSDRIKDGMEIRGLRQSELVEITGISKGALSSYISGRYVPKQNNIYLISKALNVNEAWLMGADVPMDRSTPTPASVSRGVKINVLGHIAVGIPLEAAKDIIDTEEITEELAKTGDFFGLQIKGNSMEPKFSEGDVVIVRQQDDAESGDIVIATISGNDAVCKRLKKYKDNIALISTNPEYDPMIFSSEEIEAKPVRIIGRVVELRAKF